MTTLTTLVCSIKVCITDKIQTTFSQKTDQIQTNSPENTDQNLNCHSKECKTQKRDILC